MSSQDEFIQSTSALFSAVLPNVLRSLATKVEAEFNAFVSDTNIDQNNIEVIPPPRASAFSNVQQWVDDFAAFLRCEKYQVAIMHMQELLGVDVPEDIGASVIHQDKVLTASFKFLVHAFVDFQTQQSPEDDIDQCIIEQLYQSMKDNTSGDGPNLKQRVFLEWSKKHEPEIMRMCLEHIRDAIKEALTPAADHREPLKQIE